MDIWDCQVRYHHKTDVRTLGSYVMVAVLGRDGYIFHQIDRNQERQ